MDAEGGRRITLSQTITRAVLVTLHGDRGFAHSLSARESPTSRGLRPWLRRPRYSSECQLKRYQTAHNTTTLVCSKQKVDNRKTASLRFACSNISGRTGIGIHRPQTQLTYLYFGKPHQISVLGPVKTQSGAHKGARNASTARTGGTELTTDPGRPDHGNDTTGELQG